MTRRSCGTASSPAVRGRPVSVRAARRGSTSAGGRGAAAWSRSRSTRRRTARVAATESYPEELKYHREHDWACVDGDEATLGITWFAQDALGELVHFEAPDAGSTISKDGAYGEVESVKAVSDLISPLSGEVLEVNQKVVEAPEIVNEDPYGDGWLIRIRLTNPDEREQLLDVAAYKAVLAES